MPAVGSSGEARVGDPVYTKHDYQAETVVRLAQPVQRNYPSCFRCSISVPAGAILDEKSTGEGYCTRETYAISGLVEKNVCFSVHPSRNEVISVRVPGTLGGWYTLDTPVAIERGDVMVGEGFKSELVYQGVASGVLRLLYREYTENLARPAFQQELTYTMNAGGVTEVGFRSLNIEVDSADNSSIRYRILSGL